MITDTSNTTRPDPPFEVIDVASTGTTENPAFLDYADGTGELKLIERPTYPPSPRGRAFREMRLACGHGIGAATRLLGLRSAVDLSGLEIGSRTFKNAGDWTRAEDILLAAAESLSGLVTAVEVIQGPEGRVEQYLGRLRLRVGEWEGNTAPILRDNPNTGESVAVGAIHRSAHENWPTEARIPRSVR